MTIPVLCVVILLQVLWVFILKMKIERLEMEIAVKYSSHLQAGVDGEQKGMRSFKIGRR